MIEIKLYKVVFNTYTNCSYDTVYNPTMNEYIHIPMGGLIITEGEFEYYSRCGNGFKSLEFVGTLLKEVGK